MCSYLSTDMSTYILINGSYVPATYTCIATTTTDIYFL